MRKLEFTGTYNAPLLHDQLIASVPTFQRTHLNEGVREGLSDNGIVEINAGILVITFADDIAPAAVDAVVQAHDPG